MILTRRLVSAMIASLTFAALGQAQAQAPSKLVLYTSQPDKDAAQTVAAFRKIHPNVEVEIFRSGTTEVMAKLAAEFAAGQPRPDLLFIADSASMELLKAENRLEAYKEAKVDGIPADLIDTDRTYFGTKVISTGIIYNKAAKMVPTSWSDLAKPELKGQISMASPLYSGAAAIKLSAITARPDLGWAYVEALKANDASAVRGNGAVLRAVATGEKLYGIIVDFMAFNAQKQGSPVEFVFPKEGVTVVTEPVAILKTAQNKVAARQFVDFLLSDEGQKLSLSQGYFATRSSVGKPDWLPAGAQLNLMPVNMTGVVKTMEDDKKRFGTMFGQ
ncbi:AfuA ABC-type Fe3+ transport system, periplasmic component [Rhabdaerophilaceae bacterium]